MSVRNNKSADLYFSGKMAPKDENNPNPSKTYEPSGDLQNDDESDIAEMESVNQSLDELSSALDFIEQRTDNIMAQLKELLHSNREIRQSLAHENNKKVEDETK